MGLVRLLVFGTLVYFLYNVLKVAIRSIQRGNQRRTSGNKTDEMVQDPCCKTYITLRDAQKRVIGEREYFFCSRECADKFEKEAKHC